jgi:subtilisin family serine protease
MRTHQLFSTFSPRGSQRGTPVAAAPKGARARRRRSSRSQAGRLGSLETLETRQMLSAVPADYTRVSPDWFGSVASSASLGSLAEWGSSGVGSGSEDAGAKGLAGQSSSDVQQWIVRFSEQAAGSLAGLTNAVSAFENSMTGFRVLAGLGLPGQLLVETTSPLSNAFAALAQRTDLAYFEPSATISLGNTASSIPNDPSFGSLYGLHNVGQSGGTADADIDALEAWQISTGSDSVIVAVIDTGIDYTHPDLVDNMWVNTGEIPGNGIDDEGNGFIDDVYGYDFVDNDGDPFDDEGHGTHVAGTIGATGNNGVGVVGVSWDVSLMGLKFLGPDGGTTANAIRAVNYATMMRTRFGHNVRVTNNSWGGGGLSTGLRDAIEAGAAADIVFVAAAGNSGVNNDGSPHYPSSYTSDAVISVAATDRNDVLASFSNYGATSVDLAAPGVSILSTVPGGGYASYNGTSMATPHVSGAAALALAVDPTLSVAELRAVILDTVDGKPGLAGKMVTGGRLNVAQMLVSLSSEPTMPAAPAGVAASDGTILGGVRVSWSPSLYADSYEVWRGTSADVTAATQLAVGLSATTYTDASATLGTTYHYWVKATNSLGTSDFSLSDSGFHLASRSPNDMFADRFELTGSSATAFGSNLDATAEAGEPINFYGGKSVWWTWTAPSDGTAVLDTFGSDYDTTLAAYTGSTLSGLSLVARNDDSGDGYQSQISFVATAGQRYQIQVDGYSGNAGAIVLNLTHDGPVAPPENRAPTDISLADNQIAENLPAGSLVGVMETVDPDGGDSFTYQLVAGDGDASNGLFRIVGGELRTNAVLDFESQSSHSVRVRSTDGGGLTVEKVFAIEVVDVADPTAPPNDFFADRAELIGNSVTATGSNVDATAETGEPINFYGGKSVWWTWTAPSNGTVVIDTVGSDFDTTLAMYRGSTLGTLTRLTRNDDAVGQQSRIVLEAQAGTTYHIAVDGYDKATGSIVLNLQHTAVPDIPERLVVTAMASDYDGVTVGFNQPLDLGQLDLHGRNRPAEEVDVMLVDAAGVAVEGALVINAAGDGFRFVVGDGTLAPGAYELRIRSGATGVVSASGALLDGNDDGTAGDAYVATFSVPLLPVGTAIVGLPGIFVEAGAEVNLPGIPGEGIPLFVSADAGVMAIETELLYDPGLLTVAGVEVADGLPVGSTALINVLAPGRALIGFFSPVPLGAGTQTFVRLRASVPATAEAGRSHLLDVRAVSINEGGMEAVDDDGVHVVAAGNRPPEAVLLSGDGIEENAAAGTVVGTLAAIDPDFGDAFVYELVAGEGDSGNPLFAIDGDRLVAGGAFDFETQASHSIRVRATDAQGEWVEQVVVIDIVNVVETFIVTGLSVVDNRLDIAFSHALDVGALNLYDALDLLGAADVTLVGRDTGPVAGSLVVDAAGTGLSFVASQRLAADTYELRLASGEKAFRTTDGHLLDGDQDEVAGDDFVATFMVVATPDVQVGLRSFARAPGEVVNLAVTTTDGIPLQLESAGDVTSLQFVVTHDVALFDLYGIDLAAGLPADTTLTVQDEGDGRLVIDVTSTTPLPAGRLTLAHLRGAVPSDAALGAEALFTVGEIDVNGGLLSAAGHAAVQVIARLGDATADGQLSAVDGGLISRVAMQLDSGFAAYPRLDPRIVGDVTENAAISMLDAAMVTGAAAELGIAGQYGPVAPSAPTPGRALLRHNRQARMFELADVSGLVAANDNVLLKQALAGSSAQEQAFATMVAALIEADSLSGDSESGTHSTRKAWLNPALAAAFADPGQL